MLDQVLNAASTGSVLKRVTIVSVQPDTTVLYLRADYASQTDTSSLSLDEPTASAAPSSAGGLALSSATPAPHALVSSATTRRDVFGNLPSVNRAVEQYARTQRILPEASEPAHLDVHA